ncbi:MAG: hypothetical protein COX81_00645 [Candidatus Magasanikbacteria bacterium CG_4_10_14_0_2_um_filter_37_12]|uniref:Pseudouridine synthase n=1 Tax=Candidatus Magasanikbacteria bacterium CG_4_10_14_0_2_um_filter_37_12 TaxID=1974637 RepID=A0A2M7V9M4_9BACT|nr:MAG: hypothetical protein COX81_00645 [Candidatus Magasanikbacteria bacterium CG_4_10_14_0_2_um_filter_37_12]
MKTNLKKITIKEKDANQRLDIFLAEKTKISRSQIQKMIKNRQIKINDLDVKKNGQLLNEKDVIKIAEAEKQKIIIKKEKSNKLAKVKIIAETDDYLVVEKPSGLLTHPTEAEEKDTLSTFLQKKYPAMKKLPPHKNRPGIVHRLDKDASGLLVVAKTTKMYNHLKKQFKERTVKKEYSVLVHGIMEKNNGEIDFPIDRGSDGKMVARPIMKETTLKNIKDTQNGKDAFTEFEVEKKYARYSLLNVKISTGRTNQIRVHMLAFNHPVVGDMLYYNKKLNRKKDQDLGRIFLHAKKLSFTDLNGKQQNFKIDLPAELQNFLDKLS